jgi:hypothetical protein
MTGGHIAAVSEGGAFVTVVYPNGDTQRELAKHQHVDHNFFRSYPSMSYREWIEEWMHNTGRA